MGAGLSSRLNLVTKDIISPGIHPGSTWLAVSSEALNWHYCWTLIDGGKRGKTALRNCWRHFANPKWQRFINLVINICWWLIGDDWNFVDSVPCMTAASGGGWSEGPHLHLGGVSLWGWRVLRTARWIQANVSIYLIATWKIPERRWITQLNQGFLRWSSETTWNKHNLTRYSLQGATGRLILASLQQMLTQKSQFPSSWNHHRDLLVNSHINFLNNSVLVSNYFFLPFTLQSFCQPTPVPSHERNGNSRHVRKNLRNGGYTTNRHGNEQSPSLKQNHLYLQ